MLLATPSSGRSIAAPATPWAYSGGGHNETINDLIKTLKQCHAPKSVTVLQMVARDRDRLKFANFKEKLPNMQK